MKILLLSRAGVITNKFATTLQNAGFVVNQYDLAEDVTAYTKSDTGLALIMGPAVNESDARTTLRKLRSTGDDRPVLVMAPDALFAQRVALLNAGADDVCPHVCTVEEISARLRAIVRRCRGLSRSELAIGDLVLDLNNRSVSVQDIDVSLTTKEYQIIEVLAINKGKVLSKDTIMNHLYDYNSTPDPKIIDVFICKIRKKLAQAGCQIVIHTVWGQGYAIRENRPADRMNAPGRRELEAVAS